MRAQTWSLDVMIAVLAFLIGFALFFYILGTQLNGSTADLEQEADTLLDNIRSSDDDTFIKDSAVVVEGLLAVREEYVRKKEELGLNNDFCIYLVDESGFVVTIPAEGEPIYGVGQDDGTVSGVDCSCVNCDS